MIGALPEEVTVNGRSIPIRTDYRIALMAFQAFNDPEVPARDKPRIAVDLVMGLENIDPREFREAYEKVKWFLDGGKDYADDGKPHPKTMDWEQDEQLIFSAVNNVARTEVRALRKLHWWTFLGYFNEIREGLFSNVLMIRQKKAKHKKLDKWEEEYYGENRDLIDIRKKITDEEKAEKDRLNQIFQ